MSDKRKVRVEVGEWWDVNNGKQCILVEIVSMKYMGGNDTRSYTEPKNWKITGKRAGSTKSITFLASDLIKLVRPASPSPHEVQALMESAGQTNAFQGERHG